MADLTPHRAKLAKLIRMLSSCERGDRVAAFNAIERLLESAGATWVDVGDLIALDEDDAKAIYEAGVQDERQRMNGAGMNGAGMNGRIVLPPPDEIAEFCHQRLARLRDDKQREFVSDMRAITQRGRNLSLKQLGFLVSLYIQAGGRT